MVRVVSEGDVEKRERVREKTGKYTSDNGFSFVFHPLSTLSSLAKGPDKGGESGEM